MTAARLRKYFQNKSLLVGRDMNELHVIRQVSTRVPKSGDFRTKEDFPLSPGKVIGPFFSHADAMEVVEKVFSGVKEDKGWRSSLGSFAGDVFVVEPMKHPHSIYGNYLGAKCRGKIK